MFEADMEELKTSYIHAQIEDDKKRQKAMDEQ
jgi:hypothetical protein